MLVAVVAGGLREELQRAFLLHRFRSDLGGAVNGLILTSVAFGLGHLLQGWDAVIVTGLLGAFWGGLYLARRSITAGVVSHGLTNAAQVMIAYAQRNL
jgi:membrane protease YdiL (CAAX protease family)